MPVLEATDVVSPMVDRVTLWPVVHAVSSVLI